VSTRPDCTRERPPSHGRSTTSWRTCGRRPIPANGSSPGWRQANTLPLAYQSPRSDLRRTNYVDLPFADNLAAFRAQRASLVDRLESMPIEHWSRGSLIRDRPETVVRYVRYLTDHDTAHCQQIETLLR
jgi:hypothetical protein